MVAISPQEMAVATESSQLTREERVGWLEEMILIRRFEERAEEAYGQGKIGGFLHLYIGEEGVAVGAMAALEPQDDVITHYRDHGYALARGLDPKAIMAELYGKATGVVKGKGGSMHLADVSKHLWGGYAIVGGHIPLAVGMALAHQYREEPHVVCCIFGDGATNIGMFHEALNMAAVWKLPVVFLVENNSYGMGTAVARASALTDTFQKAAAYHMPGIQIDGNDVETVYHCMRDAAAKARAGEGPQFVEAITYRLRGHSMGDPQRYRSRDEVEAWKPRGPIGRFQEKLLLEGLVTQEELDEIAARVEAEVNEAVEFAEKSPFPEPAELYSDVFAPEAGQKGA